jgi:general secretion pathway protein N
MKRSALIGIAAVVFLWTLLTHAPAPLLYKWVQPKLTSFALYGVDGQIAEGQASGFSINGRPVDERVQWQFQPLWLLLGRLSAHVDGSGLMQGTGSVQQGIGGLRVRSMQGSGDIKSLASLAGVGFAPLDGNAKFDIGSLRVSHGVPVSAEGSVELHGVAWALGPNPVPLGDFRATATTQNDAILIKIDPLGGPMEASGTVTFTPKTQKYDSDLKLHPKDNADPMLRNLLQTMGQPDPTGAFHLKRSGMF